VTIISHNPAGDTLIQFKRQAGDDPVYWAYAGNPSAPPADAPPVKEGVSVEFRDWAGDSLESWADVVAGLKKSTHLTANAWVDMIVQNMNPGRPDSVKNFAASYRGWLRIPEDDDYKFYVGAENAAFLFIDGERVFEQKGNHRFTVRFPAADWVDVKLTAGVHSFELHHVCGSDAALATCGFYTKLEGKKKKLAPTFVPGDMYARATLAEATGIEAASGSAAATFNHGIDDTLSAPGLNLHLARFAMQGAKAGPGQVLWDFGDGTRGTGASPMHVYFQGGEYSVTMNAPGIPPVTQRVYMWTAPVPTSPFSLAKAVDLLLNDDWQQWETQRINSLFDFLTLSEQPNRWPLVEKIGRHLLAQPDLDLKRRVTLQTIIMEALAEQGRAGDAIKLMGDALSAAGRLASLQAMVMLKGADIHRKHLKDYKEAARWYEKIINDHRGLDVPAVREAAIHWGDLYTEAGDLVQAEERYRLAKTLGGERFATTGQTEAIQRGAQLRIAEQKLRNGDVRGTRLLLEKMEISFPEQKLEGMFRLLRAETDRFAGRYEEAAQHYEVLLRLRQWAGFRDRAIHGLADCAYRSLDFKAAVEWFDKLRESFPEYYETQKLAKFHELAGLRAGGTADERFKGFVTGFEPGEKIDEPAELARLTFEPMMGIDGATVGVVRNGSGYVYARPLPNLPAGGSIWVELWYREQMTARDVSAWENATVSIYAGTDIKAIKAAKPEDQVVLGFARSHGQWRKLATKLRVPPSKDGTLRITFVNVNGSIVIDGLKVLPVTDRQADSLRNFIEADVIE
jgi:tetratricopeptide (TPR) repeat protein